MKKSNRVHRNLKRFRAIFVTMALIIAANIAISYAASGHSQAQRSVPGLPPAPWPTKSVPGLPPAPWPNS